jgi:hypothetical protein
VYICCSKLSAISRWQEYGNEFYKENIMINITYENNDAILKFPKQYVSADYVQQFLERLRLEAIVEKGGFSEGRAWDLSEQLKQEWWTKNKEKLKKRLKG